DLTLVGCTFQEDEVFTDLVGYIERDEIRPLVSKRYPLSEIRAAQEDFLAKRHPGKIVLVPPPVDGEDEGDATTGRRSRACGSRRSPCSGPSCPTPAASTDSRGPAPTRAS